MGRPLRRGGVRPHRSRLRLGRTGPERSGGVRRFGDHAGPAAIVRSGGPCVGLELAPLPARCGRGVRGPQLRTLLRGLPLHPARVAPAPARARDLGGPGPAHLLRQPGVGRRPALARAQGRPHSRPALLRAVPGLPRGDARSPRRQPGGAGAPASLHPRRHDLLRLRLGGRRGARPPGRPAGRHIVRPLARRARRHRRPTRGAPRPPAHGPATRRVAPHAPAGGSLPRRRRQGRRRALPGGRVTARRPGAPHRVPRRRNVGPHRLAAPAERRPRAERPVRALAHRVPAVGGLHPLPRAIHRRAADPRCASDQRFPFDGGLGRGRTLQPPDLPADPGRSRRAARRVRCRQEEHLGPAVRSRDVPLARRARRLPRLARGTRERVAGAGAPPSTSRRRSLAWRVAGLAGKEPLFRHVFPWALEQAKQRYAAPAVDAGDAARTRAEAAWQRAGA